MPRSPVPESDPSNPNANQPATPNGVPGFGFEADFADLAARFSAHSGGGLSPELSADLALEIVLNEVVEQACLTTGATGAAIVLERDGELVCRARSGVNAPDLGSRLDSTSGLSGECIRARQPQRCDDAFADPRVDRVACAHLGIRSLMMMPLVRSGGALVGVFEIFSSRLAAFGERDEMTLSALAIRILRNLESAQKQMDEPAAATRIMQSSSSLQAAALQSVSLFEGAGVEESAALPEPFRSNEKRPEPAEDTREQGVVPIETSPAFDSQPVQEDVPREAETGEPELAEISAGNNGVDRVSWFLGAAVVLCAVVLGVVLAHDLGFTRLTSRKDASHATAPADAKAASNPTPQDAGVQPEQAKDDEIPAGSLVVYENGKEIYRLAPNAARLNAASAAKPAKSPSAGSRVERAADVEKLDVVKLSPAAAQSELLRRVEPDYPDAAREQKIQGAVVLEVRAGADGAVEDIQVVSGPQELMTAAVDAVKQWRFRPRSVGGHPAEMQTRVTLNFRLQP